MRDDHRELKTCGHYCYPSKLLKCCACEDLRPISASGFYESYVDGEGWTNKAARDDGYCPVCNTKNYDKWMARIKEQTEKKKMEDEKKEAEELKKKLLAEEDRRKNDTGDNQVRHNVNVKYSNGDVYVGDIVKGQPHGLGRMDYADNDDDILYYDGNWKNGKHEGVGKKVWIDDMWYDGEWKNGMMHGHGVFHVNDVDIMEGRFEEDVFQD